MLGGTGKINKNCRIYEDASERLPILTDAAYEKYFDTKFNEDLVVKMDNASNFNEGIRAIGDISVKGQCINGNDIAIVSETGSIDISADNISLSGFIYAPYGSVTIAGE